MKQDRVPEACSVAVPTGSLLERLDLGVDGFVRKELEMELQRRGWQPRSEWGREIFANGVAEGMLEGERLGIAKGELLGQVKGRAAAVIAQLEVRGISVSTTLREQVMACTDLALLDRWFRRAATAHSLEETFAP